MGPGNPPLPSAGDVAELDADLPDVGAPAGGVAETAPPGVAPVDVDELEGEGGDFRVVAPGPGELLDSVFIVR